MTDLMQELKEDLRRQKLENIVIDNGGKIIAAAVFIVILTASFYFYNQYKIKTNIQAGEKFFEAVENTKSDEKLLKLEELQKSLPDSYKSLAQMKIADEYIAKENLAEAAKILEQISKSSKYDQSIKEMAELKLIDILIKQKENEENILKRLDALSQAKSVFKYSAMEMKANYFIENSRNADAKEIFLKLSEDKNTPENIAKRANLMIK